MKNRTDTVIIGAGASGLFLGTLLNHKNILILDNNQKVGNKLLISGGGRCNFTNDKLKSSNYLGNQRFIRNIIKRFDQHQLLSWLDHRGLTPELRKKSQYFCKTTAKEMVDVLKKDIDRGVFRLGTVVKKVEKKGDLFEVYTNKGIIEAHNVVVASGGLSFPKLGATAIGYEIASSFGHTINTLAPGLVGFTVQPEQFFFKSLSGISTDVRITIGDKVVEGSLLFAHKGISGPAVLDASLYWEKGKITIDFMPNMKLASVKSSNKNISNLLDMPSRVSKAFLKELKIEDRKATQLGSEEWGRLESLKNYTFAPAGSFGYSKAEVTKGGIATDEIDASSMMSQKVEGLYFLGEVLDVTGELGGYNFQWAFSTAFVCSKAII